ncbi:PAP2 superfamily protein [uncultured archaeon]|nr:PAP2 superfamily protein [uncultured archaeon]
MMLEENLQDLKGLAGNPLIVVAMLLALILGKLVLFWQLIVGFVIAYALTITVRLLFFRRRPDKQAYHNFIGRFDAGSFPSLHAMRASLFATLLSLYFSNSLLTALFALCAVAVGITRVVQKRHFISDVIVGLIVGVLIAFVSVWLVARFIS